jgi:hypothetical protein
VGRWRGLEEASWGPSQPSSSCCALVRTVGALQAERACWIAPAMAGKPGCPSKSTPPLGASCLLQRQASVSRSTPSRWCHKVSYKPLSWEGGGRGRRPRSFRGEGGKTTQTDTFDESSHASCLMKEQAVYTTTCFRRLRFGVFWTALAHHQLRGQGQGRMRRALPAVARRPWSALAAPTPRGGLSLEDLDYDLPQERIAQRPCSPRDASKLLVGVATEAGELGYRVHTVVFVWSSCGGMTWLSTIVFSYSFLRFCVEM